MAKSKVAKFCPFCGSRLKRIPIYSIYTKGLRVGSRKICIKCGARGTLENGKK